MAKDEGFFSKPVNKHRKSSMKRFLLDHERYWTMNSWNGLASYANCMKLHRLNIPENLIDKAYEVICGDVVVSEFEYDVRWLIDEFTRETGYDAGFNGHSGGYLVLYQTRLGQDGIRRTCSMGIGDDVEELDFEDLREQVDLVGRFDRLCDDVRGAFLYFLENAEVVEETFAVMKTAKYLRLPAT